MSRTKLEQLKFEAKLEPFYSKENKKYFCKKCSLQIKSNYINHYNICNGSNGSRSLYRRRDISTIIYSKFCDLGCGQKSSFFYKTGKAYCSFLGNNCLIKTNNDSNKKKGKKRPDLLGRIPYNKGIKKELSSVIVKNNKSKKSLISHNVHNWQGKTHTSKTKTKISQDMLNRYANGWQSTSCGRAKSYPYDSPIAGKMNLTGTWEVAFAQTLDKENIKWSRNKKRFNYIKPDGNKATYLPDFYIDEWNVYIEIKGYETDLDKAKWSKFSEPLLVVRKKEIFQFKKWLKEDVEINKEKLKQLLVVNK